MPALSEYVIFLLDSQGNVIEKNRVKEPQVSFHGRLLMFYNSYFVQVGNLKQRVYLRGTPVLMYSPIGL